MKLENRKRSSLGIIMYVCGPGIILCIVMATLLTIVKNGIQRYFISTINNLAWDTMLYLFILELFLDIVGERIFGSHKFFSFNRLVTVLTGKFSDPTINWRSHYTTGDIENMYEYINSIVDSVKYSIIIVSKLAEFAYSFYLISRVRSEFFAVLLFYTLFTLVLNIPLTIYGYTPVVKKRRELQEIRNRLLGDITLNLNLLAMHIDSSRYIVERINSLNKKILGQCIKNVGLVIVSVFFGYIVYDVCLTYFIFSSDPISRVKIFILFASVCDPLFWVLDTVPEIVDTSVKFGKIASMLNQDSDILDGRMELDNLSPNYEIEFRNVSFSYDKKSTVLRDVNFTVRKGERIAFVGESGCGKTTIVKLLTRQLDPTSGEILIDGNNIRNFTLESLRRIFGIVSQDVEIMADTLGFNISMAALPRIASNDEILSCCKAALKNKVENLPEGLETFVGDRGIKLSGGLKQLIALARILISKREIIILDEATSALDNISETEVLNAIDEELPGRTTIAIAHRLTTVMDYDRIHVVKNGRIVESGTYQELAEKNGEFSRMLDVLIEKTRRKRVRKTSK